MIWHLFFQPFIEYGFMRRALVVCLALSVSTTALGVFLQLRRMSLMGDAFLTPFCRVSPWDICSAACRCWR
jgi:hypothetical protein